METSSAKVRTCIFSITTNLDRAHSQAQFVGYRLVAIAAHNKLKDQPLPVSTLRYELE